MKLLNTGKKFFLLPISQQYIDHSERNQHLHYMESISCRKITGWWVCRLFSLSFSFPLWWSFQTEDLLLVLPAVPTSTVKLHCVLHSVFIQWRLLLWASLVLSDWLGILPPRVTSPNHLCDNILGLSESPLFAKRLQGTNILELNSFAFQQPCHHFQVWILLLAQHRPVSTLQSNPSREKGRDGIILTPFLLSHDSHPSKH